MLTEAATTMEGKERTKKPDCATAEKTSSDLSVTKVPGHGQGQTLAKSWLPFKSTACTAVHRHGNIHEQEISG